MDTSSWIEQLRADGNPDVRARVEQLIITGEAAWCPVIRLELWNGARGQREAKALSKMEKVLPELEITSVVWDLAYSLAQKSRAAGLTVPPQDLLVTACATHHQVPVEHCDFHFEQLSRL